MSRSDASWEVSWGQKKKINMALNIQQLRWEVPRGDFRCDAAFTASVALV